MLGLMLAEWYESKDGKQRFLTEEEAREGLGKKYISKTGKMSKSLRNYRSPQEIFDNHGADALRWYFFANQPPWSSIIYAERAIRDSIPEFLLRLWNVLRVFTIYAEIDQFEGASSATGDLDQLNADELQTAPTYRAAAERSELDRWILSELAGTVEQVVVRMDRYDSYGACQQINALVDALSNWYVRRCRGRYWGEATANESTDKADAYWTLYEVLLDVSKLIAPFVPFLAEKIWQTLTESVSERVRESVHLCDYPSAAGRQQDVVLGVRMQVLREIASLGRCARMDAKLKVRQPLQRVEVSLATDEHIAWLTAHDGIVREELNVKEIAYNAGNSPYVDYQVLPNFKKLGPKVGKRVPLLKQTLATVDGATLLADLQANGQVTLPLGDEPLILENDDIEVRLKAKSGWTAAQGKFAVVVLNTELTEELVREGYVRDLVRFVQEERKQMDLQFTDRIEVQLAFQSDSLNQAITENEAYIKRETLATSICCLAALSDDATDENKWQAIEVAETPVHLSVRVNKATS